MSLGLVFLICAATVGVVFLIGFALGAWFASGQPTQAAERSDVVRKDFG
jgi:hypothetical protein